MLDRGRHRRNIKRRDLEALYRLAELSYPYECCGVITAQQSATGVVEEIHPCPNIAGELHVMNPDAYPRDARTSYVLGGETWLTIFQRISDGEVTLRAIYHSHVDTEPFFSVEDRARALAVEDPPQPIFPEALHIVLSVDSGRINQLTPHRAFQWNPDQQDFTQVDLVIEDSPHDPLSCQSV